MTLEIIQVKTHIADIGVFVLILYLARVFLHASFCWFAVSFKCSSQSVDGIFVATCLLCDLENTVLRILCSFRTSFRYYRNTKRLLGQRVSVSDSSLNVRAEYHTLFQFALELCDHLLGQLSVILSPREPSACGRRGVGREGEGWEEGGNGDLSAETWSPQILKWDLIEYF